MPHTGSVRKPRKREKAMDDDRAERREGNEPEGTAEPERVQKQPPAGGSLKPERVQYEAPAPPADEPAAGRPPVV